MKILVVGAGPAGLYAAWKAQREGHQVEVWEASHAVGGWCQTLPWPHGQGMYELGPRNLPWRRGGALDELLKALALPFHEAPPKPHWFLKHGQLKPMPWGLGWLRTDLLSRRARLRLLLEPLQRPSPFEESLHDFIARRLGAEFAREILPAVSASLLGASPEALDAALIPALARMETRGGLARAALRSRTRRIVPQGGMGALTQALAASLPVRLHAKAQQLEFIPSEPWCVQSQTDRVFVDQILLALPPKEAGRLLAPHAPQAAELLATLPSQGLVSWHSRHPAPPNLAQGFSLFTDPQEGCLGATASLWGKQELQVRTSFPISSQESGPAWLQAHLGLEPANSSHAISTPQALPIPQPGDMTRLREALASLPKGLDWIGVPRFGAGIAETLEGLRGR